MLSPAGYCVLYMAQSRACGRDLGIQSLCMNGKENVQQVEVLHGRKGALSLLNPMFLLQKQSQSNSLNARMQQSMSEP